MQFKDIIGQEEIKNRLKATVAENRVAHTQLFLGPPGSGKLAMAIAYAQYINCENKTEQEDSCNVCHSCIKFNKLIHPDLHLFFPTTSTKNIKNNSSKLFINDYVKFLRESDYYIDLNDWYNHLGVENKQGIINKDDCNEISKILSLKSYESAYKIIIIWMVEKLFHSAAPKLLKVLEEPPDNTLFVLISDNYDDILNTISSRSQLIKFKKISSKEIEDVLVNKNKIDRNDANKVSKRAEGNYIEAQRLLQSKDKQINNFALFQDWMRICFRIDKKFDLLNNYIDTFAALGRENQKKFLNFSLSFISEIVKYNNITHYKLNLEAEETAFIINFSPYIHINNVLEINDNLNKAIDNIERNINPKILFMDLSFCIYKSLTTHNS